MEERQNRTIDCVRFCIQVIDGQALGDCFSGLEHHSFWGTTRYDCEDQRFRQRRVCARVCRIDFDSLFKTGNGFLHTVWRPIMLPYLPADLEEFNCAAR